MDRNSPGTNITLSTTVALRKESVDRNLAGFGLLKLLAVALRKESVDRNSTPATMRSVIGIVALRKESVDRNSTPATMRSVIGVALRKESVDRNAWVLKSQAGKHKSLSARRAWIEIAVACCAPLWMPCRSPQGERG